MAEIKPQHADVTPQAPKVDRQIPESGKPRFSRRHFLGALAGGILAGRQHPTRGEQIVTTEESVLAWAEPVSADCLAPSIVYPPQNYDVFTSPTEVKFVGPTYENVPTELQISRSERGKNEDGNYHDGNYYVSREKRRHEHSGATIIEEGTPTILGQPGWFIKATIPASDWQPATYSEIHGIMLETGDMLQYHFYSAYTQEAKKEAVIVPGVIEKTVLNPADNPTTA